MPPDADDPDSTTIQAPASPIPPDARCKTCGYLLRGLPELRCPECGHVFDPGDPETMRMPGQPAIAIPAPLRRFFDVPTSSMLRASSAVTTIGMGVTLVLGWHTWDVRDTAADYLFLTVLFCLVFWAFRSIYRALPPKSVPPTRPRRIRRTVFWLVSAVISVSVDYHSCMHATSICCFGFGLAHSTNGGPCGSNPYRNREHLRDNWYLIY